MLIGLWSAAGASARSDVFERAIGPWIYAATGAGTLSHGGTVTASGPGGTTALVSTLVWVDAGSRADLPGPTGHAVIPPEQAPAAHDGWRGQAPQVWGDAERILPLRHLLCEYRL